MTDKAPSTIGELERRAGIGRSDDERFAFWQPFAHLRDRALDAGVAQLHFLAERRAADHAAAALDGAERSGKDAP